MDDDQQFCLRWNNHQSTLVSVFDTLFEKGIHVDCTLAAEGKTLKAHKVVLSACSPYFENVLSQQYDKHPIIILKDVKYAELRAMMDYMYRGEVNISQDQLAALLKAAESLQIKGLSDNKPSRPPSRPAQAVAAHPPRAPSPPPQTRDGSAEGRAASLSPNRRRKLARRSPEAEPDEAPKEEPPAPRDPVEDLTLDEELAQEPAHDPDHERSDHQEPPAHHNDVVRNFQWHMERSQDELMSSNDSIRESQGDVDFFKTMMQSMLPIMPMKTKNYWSQYDTSFECEKCKRKYRHKSTYRRHVTYECGKEPMFRCPFLECTYKAYQKTHTDAHIKTKHKLTALEYKR